MLILAPIAALILAFLGWGDFRLPVELDRFLLVALAISAVACAHPLRQTLLRAKPLGWGGKLFVFTLVLLLWFTSLAPLLVIINAKFDSSDPENIERTVLESKARGPKVCLVKVPEWKSGEGERWLWLDCPLPEQIRANLSKVKYSVKKGALGFPWVSSNASGM